jgi:hypothetical protein
MMLNSFCSQHVISSACHCSHRSTVRKGQHLLYSGTEPRLSVYFVDTLLVLELPVNLLAPESAWRKQPPFNQTNVKMFLTNGSLCKERCDDGLRQLSACKATILIG